MQANFNEEQKQLNTKSDSKKNYQNRNQDQQTYEEDFIR